MAVWLALLQSIEQTEEARGLQHRCVKVISPFSSWGQAFLQAHQREGWAWPLIVDEDTAYMTQIKPMFHSNKNIVLEMFLHSYWDVGFANWCALKFVSFSVALRRLMSFSCPYKKTVRWGACRFFYWRMLTAFDWRKNLNHVRSHSRHYCKKLTWRDFDVTKYIWMI